MLAKEGLSSNSASVNRAYPSVIKQLHKTEKTVTENETVDKTDDADKRGVDKVYTDKKAWMTSNLFFFV